MPGASRTIFITGGTGLVGSHVVEEALARGHKVRVLVRASSDTRQLDTWGVEKILGNLEDSKALAQGVAGADWVINCAAKVGDWGDLDDFRRLNVDALRLLLDAATQAHVARFVHVSSLGVYEGRDHHGTDETTPPALNSLDAYTRSKTEAELLVLAYRPEGPSTLLPYVEAALKKSTIPPAERKLDVTIVRPGFIYGERDRTVLPKLLTRLRSKVFAYFGSGQQALNCIYVKNLVYGIFLAAETPSASCQVYNLTDGETVTKRQFVGTVARLAGLPEPKRKIPRPIALWLAKLMERRARRKKATEPPLINMARYKFLGLNLDYSIAKARKQLGYKPPYTTEQGLERAVAELLASEKSNSAGKSI